MAIQFQGYVFQDDGDALNGATVQLLQVSDGAEEASTTSDSNGLWTFSEANDDRYDIKITSGSSVRYRKWADEMSVKAMDIRNNSANTEPALQVTNLTNNASNQVAVFSGANSTRADGDEIYLSFNLADDGGNQHEFARLTAEATDVSNGSEDGQFRFGVSVAGTMTDVFTIDSSTGGSTTMTLDVSGDLVLDADGGDILFKDGGTTFGSATNTSGNLIIKSGTTTALTFAGANVTAAGTIGSGAITSTGIVTGTGFTAGSAVLAEAELELLDGLTAGTAIASKVVTTDASIDTSGQRNLTITGALTAATIDLSSSADFAGDLVLSGGADGALQFTNAGENSIKIPDNQGSALIIEEANNAYITFDTQDGAEAITVAKATTFSAGIADSGTISAGTWNGTAIASAYLDSDTAHLSGTQTFTGAKTFTSTVTVGADDTGHDVKFFGATSGAYLLWDESADKLLTAGNTFIDIVKDKLMIGSTAVTTTAAELNVLDAVTAGTVTGSLGVVVDSNKDIGTFRNITLSGELDAGSLDVSGNADIDGTLETDALTIDGTAIVAQATTSAVGGVELATSAEINTSTDAARAMTPDLFAASNYGLRYVALSVGDPSTAMSTGNNKAKFHVPAGLNGMDLVEVHAEVSTAPAGSTADIQLSRNGSADMLSTKITIDASETGSDTAATAAVINTSNDNVSTNDTIQIDIDQVGSSTAGSGLVVTLGFRIP